MPSLLFYQANSWILLLLPCASILAFNNNIKVAQFFLLVITTHSRTLLTFLLCGATLGLRLIHNKALYLLLNNEIIKGFSELYNVYINNSHFVGIFGKRKIIHYENAYSTSIRRDNQGFITSLVITRIIHAFISDLVVSFAPLQSRFLPLPIRLSST